MAIQPDEAGQIFEQLVESAPDAVIVIDASGTIQLINGQVEQLFGYSSRVVVVRPCRPPTRRRRSSRAPAERHSLSRRRTPKRPP